MAYLQWSSSLDTGVDVIDEQHKRIVQYINDLYDAQTSGSGNVAEVIEDLVDYTVSHFAFEESLMEQAGYPFLEPHKKVHALFIKKVTVFVERFKAGEDVAGELLSMLQRWLVNHIRNEDGDYSEIVQANMKKIKRANSGGFLSRFFK
ncbi:MAG: bacteriohemerythrin [Candidatus Sedimenticola sp. PURPLELP]